MSFLRKSSTQAFGLEIGTSAIKVVVLEPGGARVQQAAMTPTPAGVVVNGVVAEPQAVAQEIRMLLEQNNISGRQVVTALPNQATIIRNIMIPKMEIKELRESSVVRYEAERYIPYPMEDVTMDFDVLDNPAMLPPDSQMEVVIAAVTNEVVNRYMETLSLAGLQPVAIDVKSFASLRAIIGQNAVPDETILNIEVGASTSVISLMRGERLLMTRNINVSADEFTMAIQKNFDLDFLAAEALKISYGDPNGVSPVPAANPARVGEALHQPANELANEIRRSIEYHRVQNGEFTMDRVVLTGGGAKLGGLAETLHQALTPPSLELVNPWETVELPDDLYPSVGPYGPEYAVALGLALRGVQNG